MYAIKQIKIYAEYRYMLPRGLGWICQIHLGVGLSASAKVPDKTALAWVASRYSVHILICILNNGHLSVINPNTSALRNAS